MPIDYSKWNNLDLSDDEDEAPKIKSPPKKVYKHACTHVASTQTERVHATMVVFFICVTF